MKCLHCFQHFIPIICLFLSLFYTHEAPTGHNISQIYLKLNIEWDMHQSWPYWIAGSWGLLPFWRMHRMQILISLTQSWLLPRDSDIHHSIRFLLAFCFIFHNSDYTTHLWIPILWLQLPWFKFRFCTIPHPSMIQVLRNIRILLLVIMPTSDTLLTILWLHIHITYKFFNLTPYIKIPICPLFS